MRRVGGRFMIEQLSNDFVGASAQTIYRDIFDVEEVDKVLLGYSTDKARRRLTDRRDAHQHAVPPRRRAASCRRQVPEELRLLFVDRRRLSASRTSKRSAGGSSSMR